MVQFSSRWCSDFLCMGSNHAHIVWSWVDRWFIHRIRRSASFLFSEMSPTIFRSLILLLWGWLERHGFSSNFSIPSYLKFYINEAVLGATRWEKIEGKRGIPSHTPFLDHRSPFSWFLWLERDFSWDFRFLFNQDCYCTAPWLESSLEQDPEKKRKNKTGISLTPSGL